MGLEIVFAKVRGHCSWPAKVVCPSPMPNKYVVKFFGDSKTATVPKNKIWPFQEFKEKFGHGSKNQTFVDGMKEAENAIASSDLQQVENSPTEIGNVLIGNSGDKNNKSDNINKKENKKPRSRAHVGKGGPKVNKLDVTNKKRNPLKELLDDESDINKKLQDNMKEVNGGYVCIHCGFATGIKLTAKNHAIKCGTARKKSKKRPKEHKCTLCNEVFVSKKMLNTHFKIDHETSQYKCTTCGKQFNEKYKYTRHLRIHSKEEFNFECEFCSKKFRDNYGLERHKPKHKIKQVHQNHSYELLERASNFGGENERGYNIAINLMEVDKDRENMTETNSAYNGDRSVDNIEEDLVDGDQNGDYEVLVGEESRDVICLEDFEWYNEWKLVDEWYEKVVCSWSRDVFIPQNEIEEGNGENQSIKTATNSPDEIMRESSPNCIKGDAQPVSDSFDLEANRTTNKDSEIHDCASLIQEESIFINTLFNDLFTNFIMAEAIIDDLLTTVVNNCNVKCKKQFRCPKCNKTASDNAHLKEHIRRMHTPGLFNCKKCTKTFDDKLALTNHDRSCFYICKDPLCLKTFKRKDRYESHSRWHINMLRRMF